MNLTQARTLFRSLRKDNWRIVVMRHAYAGHPERRFTEFEIATLVHQASGQLHDNQTAASATPGSFMWVCKDAAQRQCEIVVTFEAKDGKPDELIIAISAFRRLE